MTTAADVEQLRARARSIRRTASLIGDCAATRLVDRAGDDTWIGPTPQRCRDDLDAIGRSLRAAHDELLAAARLLEVQADLAAAAAGGGRVTVS